MIAALPPLTREQTIAYVSWAGRVIGLLGVLLFALQGGAIWWLVALAAPVGVALSLWLTWLGGLVLLLFTALGPVVYAALAQSDLPAPLGIWLFAVAGVLLLIAWFAARSVEMPTALGEAMAVDALRWEARIIGVFFGVLILGVLAGESGLEPVRWDVAVISGVILWAVIFAGIIIAFFTRRELIAGVLLVIGSVALQIWVAFNPGGGGPNAFILMFGLVGGALLVCWWLTQGAAWWRGRRTQPVRRQPVALT